MPPLLLHNPHIRGRTMGADIKHGLHDVPIGFRPASFAERLRTQGSRRRGRRSFVRPRDRFEAWQMITCCTAIDGDRIGTTVLERASIRMKPGSASTHPVLSTNMIMMLTFRTWDAMYITPHWERHDPNSSVEFRGGGGAEGGGDVLHESHKCHPLVRPRSALWIPPIIPPETAETGGTSGVPIRLPAYLLLGLR